MPKCKLINKPERIGYCTHAGSGREVITETMLPLTPTDDRFSTVYDVVASTTAVEYPACVTWHGTDRRRGVSLKPPGSHKLSPHDSPDFQLLLLSISVFTHYFIFV